MKSKDNKQTVVYFFVNDKRHIECRKCKLGVFLDQPEFNHQGIETDLTGGVFTTGSMTEFEKHIAAHKSLKHKLYKSNIKEVKAFFKRLA